MCRYRKKYQPRYKLAVEKSFPSILEVSFADVRGFCKVEQYTSFLPKLYLVRAHRAKRSEITSLIYAGCIVFFVVGTPSLLQLEIWPSKPKSRSEVDAYFRPVFTKWSGDF